MPFACWGWVILGFGLLILEMLLPTGFVLLWLGCAAVAVAGVVWMVPGLGLGLEVLIWGLLSVVAVLAWRRFRPLAVRSTGEAPLNQRGLSYVGRVFTLDTAVVDGVGHVRVDDSQWRIVGADADAGSKVRVIRADGATLHVEPVA